MDSIQILQEERNQILYDLFDMKQPKRVLNALVVDATYALEYLDCDMVKDQYNVDNLLEAADRMTALIDSDIMPITIFRVPSIFRMMGAKTIVLDRAGIAQHPNVEGMTPDEYSDFSKDPFKFIMTVLIPRLYTELDKPEPERTLRFGEVYLANTLEGGKVNSGKKIISDKYGKCSRGLFQNISLAPMDFISDYLRSFTGITKDIRRCPEKVLEAVEAITPLLYKKSIPVGMEPSKQNRTFFALHMPTFLREKDFAKFWWPAFLKLAQAVDEAGYGMNFFCEDDWTRYLDYLQELPEGISLKFEKGDPKLFKEKLGKKFILNGWYPAPLLKTGTKQEVENKCKELLDILAPGGNYYLTTTTSFMRTCDAKLENIQALCNCVKTYGVY
ncbi:MAG: uroporphyrinogen decarboxylase family protein [Eubacterium sp.]